MIQSGKTLFGNDIKEEIKKMLYILCSAKKIPGESELPYPMDIEYGFQNWDVVAALREYISNAIDTKNEYQLQYQDGYTIIEDKGPGLSQESFIFGKSTKREAGSSIGQHGEGSKMSYITLLRNNRKLWVETVGFSVIAEKTNMAAVMKNNGLVKSDQDETKTELMKLRFFPNNKISGTSIFVESTEEEFLNAKNLFLALGDIKKIDDNIYLPAKNIYIVGLKTSELPNSLFGYNINDKTLSNRDRNMVDITKLSAKIGEIMTAAKSVAFIKEYLSSFQTNPGAYEYQIEFKIAANKKEIWKKTLDKLYPKACISSDLRSDLNACMMGYNVLRNIPLNILNILLDLGMQKSEFYAKNYQGEGIKENNKIIFPITEDYISNWGKVEAIREIISNSLDAGEKVRIVHNGIEGRISDNGIGIAKKHFVFGVSEKGTTAIGKWGEGLKAACLILARTNSDMKIETIGYTYEPKLEYNKEFEMKLLVIYYTKNARTKGTSIAFKCKESELEDAKKMFVNYKASGKRKVTALGYMDIYMDTPGIIYSNGLETAKENTIFGYNIKDKNIVISRDRNTVSKELLKGFISKFINEITDETLIKELVTSWEKNKDKLEYSFYYNLKNKDIWFKVIKKEYAKSCFSVYKELSYDKTNDDDFIAKSSGYKLLYDIPDCLTRLFMDAGVLKASEIARKYKGKSVLMGDRIIYPITKEFGKNWNVNDAIKELISNSLDTESKTNYTEVDGIITISDKGDGIQKKNLLFSGSEKTSDQIGTFGEGLKMASLVLARNNRNLRVITKGYEYIAEIVHDASFKADVLVVKIVKNRKRVGTDIYFKGSAKELSDAKYHFLKFNSNFTGLTEQIYKPGGSVFVNGVFVQNIKSLYSYNIIGEKDIINRDRKSVEITKTKEYIQKLLSNTNQKEVIEKILTNRDESYMECQFQINPTRSVKEVWKQILIKLFGKSCFATGTDFDGVAKDKGFNLILNMPSLLKILFADLGILPANNVVALRGDENIIKKKYDMNRLSEKGKKRYTIAKELFTQLYGTRLAAKIELIESFKESINTDSVWGLYNSGTDIIYVLADIVDNVDKYEFETLMGVLIHEQTHRKSGAYDRTREFENALSMELGRIAVLLFKASSSKEKVHII